MKKRKLATIALASAMMVTSFAACGNSETSTTAGAAATTQAGATEAPSTEAQKDTEAPTTEKPVEEAVTPSVLFCRTGCHKKHRALQFEQLHVH